MRCAFTPMISDARTMISLGYFTVEALTPHGTAPEIVVRTGNERVATFAYETIIEERRACKVILRHSNRVLRCKEAG